MKKEKLNKKKLLIVSTLSIFTILGGTLAYFQTTDDIENIFNTGKYEHTIKEEFTSPDNWLPGTTTKKEVTVTNNGNVDMAIRASIEERWTSANGENLSLTQDNKKVAIINFNDGWTLSNDGYYYYGSKDNKTKLLPNEESSSFISSVTFNKDTNISLNKVVSDDGKTITYTSNGNGYDNAEYKLIITIDTVQYDKANIFWD